MQLDAKKSSSGSSSTGLQTCYTASCSLQGSGQFFASKNAGSGQYVWDFYRRPCKDSLPPFQEYPPWSDWKVPMCKPPAHLKANEIGAQFLLSYVIFPKFIQQFDIMHSGVPSEHLICLTLQKCVTSQGSGPFFALVQLIYARHTKIIGPFPAHIWYQLLPLRIPIQWSTYVFSFLWIKP